MYHGGLTKPESLTNLLAAMGHKVSSTGNTWPMTAELIRGFMAKGPDALERGRRSGG